MASLYVAYRRWSARDGQLWDTVVRLGQILGFNRRNDLVHAETVFASDWTSCTSTLEEGPLFRPAPSMNDPLWVFEPISCTADEAYLVRLHCQRKIDECNRHKDEEEKRTGKRPTGYDKWGAVRSAVCLGREHPWWWFCSEWTADDLQVLSICRRKPASWFDPAKLFSEPKDRAA